MKYIITSKSNHLQSKFDLRFGRAFWFCLYNPENGEIEFIENENKDLNGGAGTKTAEKIAELGVTKVISGDFGPKAKTLLKKLKIQMIVLDEASLSIVDIIHKIRN